jgi:CBS domain containing-hemolysin-like protein
MLISSLNDRLEIDLEEEGSLTVGGLIMERLGRIPQVGDAVEIEGIRLRVDAVDRRSVTEVCVSLTPERVA